MEIFFHMEEYFHFYYEESEITQNELCVFFSFCGAAFPQRVRICKMARNLLNYSAEQKTTLSY